MDRLRNRICIFTLFWLIILIIFLFNLSYCNEGGRFADNLFSEGDYLRAISEYKRLSFISLNNDSVVFYQFRIAECYRRRGNFREAKKYFDKLMFESIGDPVLEEKLVISSSICSINMGTLEYASITLGDFARKEEVSDSIYYLLGICFLKERKLEDADNEFKKIKSDELKRSAFQMLEEISSQNFKSPELALLLSRFIPGAGQIYSSKPFHGIVSFSLNLSLGYLTYKAISEDRNLDAILIIYFGLQRFYFGNLAQARKYPREYNKRILDSIRIE